MEMMHGDREREARAVAFSHRAIRYAGQRRAGAETAMV